MCSTGGEPALAAQAGAADAVQAASAALAAAEEEMEGSIEALCQLEVSLCGRQALVEVHHSSHICRLLDGPCFSASLPCRTRPPAPPSPVPHNPSLFPPPQDHIYAAFRRRAAAQDALLREQAGLAGVVQEAAAALEQHAAAVAAAAIAEAEADLLAEAEAEAAAAPAGPQPLTAAQLAALASPEGGASCTSSGSVRSSDGSGRRSSGGLFGGAAARGMREAEAEALAVSSLLEDAWFCPPAARQLDRGECAASSKDHGEEEEAAAAAAAEEVGESEEVSSFAVAP